MNLSVKSANLLRAVRSLQLARHLSSTVPAFQMKFTFASPGQVFYNEANVKQVDVPSMSGDFGILAHHVPMLAVLKPGVLKVFEDDATSKSFFVSSGTVTVNDDSTVQILAEEAVAVESLDRAAAQEGLNSAQSRLSSSSGDVARAEAQIAVETFEALVKATQ